MLWCETLSPRHIPWAKGDTLLRVANWNDISIQQLGHYPFPSVSLACPTTAETGVERVKQKLSGRTKV